MFELGLAVGEIVPLMNSAKQAQIDLQFELIADYEIVRLQTRGLSCHMIADQSEFMEFNDAKKISRWKKWRNKIERYFTYTTYIEEETFESAYEIEDKEEKQIKILVEIKDKLMNSNMFHGKSKQSNQNKHAK